MGAILMLSIIGMIAIIYGAYKDNDQWKNGFLEDSVHRLFYLVGICCLIISIICFIFQLIVTR